MIVNRLVKIQLLKRGAFLWFGETGIEKTFIADPAYVGKFGPFDFVGQNFASRGIEHLDCAPIRTAVLNSIGNAPPVGRWLPLVERGGAMNIVRHEIWLYAPADAIPEHIEVDMSQVTKGATIHSGDIKLPKGIKIVTHGRKDITIATVVEPVEEVVAAPVVAAADDKKKGKGKK